MDQEILKLLAHQLREQGILFDDALLNKELDPAVPTLAPLLLSKKLLSEHGYFYLFWGNDHPNATKAGKVYLHRYFAALARSRRDRGF